MIQKLSLLCLLVISAITSIAQQALINRIYVHSNGVTDTVDNAPILIDINNKVVVTGNKKITGSQYDASTAQELSNGIMTWTASFNLSTQKCWVAASCSDASGNIYITGGVATGTANGVDIFIAKYSSGGTLLWSNSYNGPNSTLDCGSAIVENGGDVYICGASDGTNTALMDYVTIKYNGGTGSQVWVSRYNYASGYDVPSSIIYNTTTNYVEVTGASGTNYIDWDIATVAYKSSDGSQQSVNRTANPGGNQDKAFSMATDTLGNVFVVGTKWNAGNSSYDISLQKLDTALNMVWIQSFDGNGLTDAGVSLALDDSLNIYVTGISYYQDSTLSNLIVLKYNSAGTLKWSSKKRPPANGSSAEGIRIKVKNDNEIFVGGNFTTGTNQDMAILRYNKFGKQTLEKTYNGPLNGKDKFLDLVLRQDSNFIFVSGRTDAGGGLDSNIIIKYEYQDFSFANVVGTDPSYMGDELIINFNSETLKMATINDRQTTFGKLSDFVADSTCNKINNALGGTMTYCQDFTTRKIFFGLTSSDTLSETRSGNFVRVPKFYCSLLVNIPESYSLTVASDSISKVKPDISYSQLNFWIKPTNANDPLFLNDQCSLHTNTLYPNAHVNVDSAWAVSSGLPHIKVGINDTGVEFDHEDLVGVSWGGFNFASSVAINPGAFVDDWNHGTGVAGVVGARRNNNLGIAGVAGGDADSNKIGVSIYDCRVMVGGGLAPIPGGPQSVLVEAINTGARGTNINGGFALNVMNNSYFIWSYGVNNKKNPNLQEQMVFANKNGVAFVATKTNNNLTVPQAVWPADWNPEIVSCVGSTGINGERSIYPTNSSAGSEWGHNLDFLAPGSFSVVTSLNTSLYPPYGGKDGSSHAAPHVSGVMGLMMSYWNNLTPNWNNLVHEDCEYLLKKACTDLTVAATYSEAVGPDARSGYGRINAYKTLKSINKNYYRIRHIDASHFSTSYTKSSAILYSNYQQYWPAFEMLMGAYTPTYIPGTIPAGTYSTEITVITTTITYSLYPSEKIVGKWPLYKESYGWDKDTVALNVSVDKPYFTKIDTVNNTTAILKTYMWRNLNNGLYYPTAYANIKSAFVLYTYDSTGTVGIEDRKIDQINQNNFQVFPNPSNDDFKLSFYTEHYDLLNYRIFDILGREIKGESFRTSFGKNTVSINFKGSYGVYILKVFDGSKQVFTQKLIKNEN